MVNINFIPDDYIQNNESRRVNLICIALLAIILIAIGGAFGAIKMRQHALNSREAAIDVELAKKKVQVITVDKLQKQRNTMWSAAITTVELIEPVPKSVVLASLTNNLPKGVSLTRLNMVQKERAANSQQKPAENKYQAIQDKEKAASEKNVSKENLLETRIEIEGVAPSDIEVASYIEQLSRSILLSDVALVESSQLSKSGAKQDTAEEKTRRFKLTAMLGRDIQVSDNIVKQIASKSDIQTTISE
jgi:Tfp pilus assembly protein PilN